MAELSPPVSSVASSVSAPVNREAVKVLAQVVGIREAARRMGLSAERVLKWSQRDPAGPWGTSAASVDRQKAQLTLSSRCPQPTKTASEAHADVLAEDSKASRSALSAGLRKVAEHIRDTLTPSEALQEAQNVKATVSSLATVHAWEAKAPAAQVMVSVQMLGMRPEELRIEAVEHECSE